MIRNSHLFCSSLNGRDGIYSIDLRVKTPQMAFSIFTTLNLPQRGGIKTVTVSLAITPSLEI